MITVLSFGQVAGITGNSISVEESFATTDDVRRWLHGQYPELLSMPYALAVNKQIIHENTPLKGDVTIALLPPFSGG